MSYFYRSDNSWLFLWDGWVVIDIRIFFTLHLISKTLSNYMEQSPS